MLLMFNLIKNGWSSQRAQADPNLSPFSAAWDGQNTRRKSVLSHLWQHLCSKHLFVPVSHIYQHATHLGPVIVWKTPKKPQKRYTVHEHRKPERQQHNKRSEGTAALTNTTKHNTASEQFWSPWLSGSFCDVMCKCCKTWLPFFSPRCVFVSCTWPFGLLFVTATTLHNPCMYEQQSKVNLIT